jgi:hypothetical protein
VNPPTPTPILARAYAGTGMLGSGFLPDSLATASTWQPDFIAADGGSTDGGPSYLATGQSMFGETATRNDLAALLWAARSARIPLIIGSAGTGGGRRNLAWLRELLLDAARERGLRFRLATIDAEQDRAQVAEAWRSGRLTALPGAPTVDAAAIEGSEAVVAMMGTEPIVAALDAGADVVLAGRASDAALFAAVPMLRGVAAGTAWHMAKVLECGAAAVTHRTRPDGMFAWLEADAFTVRPPNPGYRCTPLSVAAHALYENADPFVLTEPPGKVGLQDARYEALDERTVRVSGSTFTPAPYTVKLEGASLVGYRSIVQGGIRDPFVIRQLDAWIREVREAAATRITRGFPGVPYTMIIRRYGANGVMGSSEPESRMAHEVFLSFEITAPAQATARAMANDVRHIALHHPIAEWHGLITVLAHAHSPAVIDLGPAYRFTLHHVLRVDDPLAPFAIHHEQVGP